MSLRVVVIAVLLATAGSSWGEDFHQQEIPQVDTGTVISPMHKEDVIDKGERRVKLDREGTYWLVSEAPHLRALTPFEEAELDKEEKALTENGSDGVELHFHFNKSSPISWKPLVEKMDQARDPGTDIRVVGHTDVVGGKKYNQKLSERRALVVARYLAAHGVTKSHIHAFGVGKSDLAKVGDDAANRRTVINLDFKDE